MLRALEAAWIIDYFGGGHGGLRPASVWQGGSCSGHVLCLDDVFSCELRAADSTGELPGGRRQRRRRRLSRFIHWAAVQIGAGGLSPRLARRRDDFFGPGRQFFDNRV